MGGTTGHPMPIAPFLFNFVFTTPGWISNQPMSRIVTGVYVFLNRKQHRDPPLASLRARCKGRVIVGLSLCLSTPFRFKFRNSHRLCCRSLSYSLIR